MDNIQFFIYLAIMAVSTYLIRAIPFALASKKIENTFIKSFLCYIPYAVLAAMTFPAVFYATKNPVSATVGVIIAFILALFKRGLMTVAVAACAGVFITEIVLRYVLPF